MDDDEVQLSEEDTQKVLDWAAGTAAMIILMHNSPKGDDDEEQLERLEGFIHAVGLMRDNMPEVLVAPATIIAGESIQEARLEEELVDQFLREIDESL